MGDAGAIGSIIEDTIFVLKDMFDNDELSEDKLVFALILLNTINQNAMEQNIDLCIDDEYISYIQEHIKDI